MFFKLLMPSMDRLMKGGVVGKWHKMEGDHVGYGDDLVDVRFEIVMTVLEGSLEQKIRQSKDYGSSGSKERESRRIETPMTLVARVTSSDTGVLRRIEAGEGEYRDVGGLLAVFSSEDGGFTNPPDEHLRGASEFRVVANLVE